MKKIDRITGMAVFGFILFITCFCAGWWTDVALGGSALIGCSIGAISGIVINMLFLRRIVGRMFKLPQWALILVFLLYSIGIFGFFMGVPVFNAAMGFVAGWYAGRSAKAASLGLRDRLPGALLLSTAVLALFCAASAWLALSDASTAANLEGMLGLRFHVTTEMIWGTILIGGAALLLVQAGFVKLAGKLAYRM